MSFQPFLKNVNVENEPELSCFIIMLIKLIRKNKAYKYIVEYYLKHFEDIWNK